MSSEETIQAIVREGSPGGRICEERQANFLFLFLSGK